MMMKTLHQRVEAMHAAFLEKLQQHHGTPLFYQGMQAAEKGAHEYSYPLGLNSVEREQWITGHCFFRDRRTDLRAGRETELTRMPLPPPPQKAIEEAAR